MICHTVASCFNYSKYALHLAEIHSIFGPKNYETTVSHFIIFCLEEGSTLLLALDCKSKNMRLARLSMKKLKQQKVTKTIPFLLLFVPWNLEVEAKFK